MIYLLILGNFSFIGNSLNSFDLIIFDVLGFEGDILDSALDWNVFNNWSTSDG